jgi:phosphoserine phosphatase
MLTDKKPLIILFDLDSTLTTVETVDVWATEKGILDELAHVTHKGISKGVSLNEIFTKRLALLAPRKQDRSHLRRIALQHINPDAVACIKTLSTYEHVEIGILSLHFQDVVDDVCEFLGVNHTLSFGITITHHEDGTYKSHDESSVLMQNDGKGLWIRQLKKRYPDAHIIHVGDNMTDQVTQPYADMFIGYGGVITRPEVVKNSKYFVHSLMDIEKLIEKYL